MGQSHRACAQNWGLAHPRSCFIPPPDGERCENVHAEVSVYSVGNIILIFFSISGCELKLIDLSYFPNRNVETIKPLHEQVGGWNSDANRVRPNLTG